MFLDNQARQLEGTLERGPTMDINRSKESQALAKLSEQAQSELFDRPTDAPVADDAGTHRRTVIRPLPLGNFGVRNNLPLNEDLGWREIRPGRTVPQRLREFLAVAPSRGVTCK
jgi:hypothetical protein